MATEGRPLHDYTQELKKDNIQNIQSGRLALHCDEPSHWIYKKEGIDYVTTDILKEK